jgi:hypothetical protein
MADPPTMARMGIGYRITFTMTNEVSQDETVDCIATKSTPAVRITSLTLRPTPHILFFQKIGHVRQPKTH